MKPALSTEFLTLPIGLERDLGRCGAGCIYTRTDS